MLTKRVSNIKNEKQTFDNCHRSNLMIHEADSKLNSQTFRLKFSRTHWPQWIRQQIFRQFVRPMRKSKTILKTGNYNHKFCRWKWKLRGKKQR